MLFLWTPYLVQKPNTEHDVQEDDKKLYIAYESSSCGQIKSALQELSYLQSSSGRSRDKEPSAGFTAVSDLALLPPSTAATNSTLAHTVVFMCIYLYMLLYIYPAGPEHCCHQQNSCVCSCTYINTCGSTALPCVLQCFLLPWFHTDCQRGHTLGDWAGSRFVWTLE